MSRTLRTNSASGSSSSSAAGLTLADVNTTLATYDIPKLLKTIDTPDGTTYLEIPNLDTTLYERFYILMRNFGCYNNTYFTFGGMSGTTKFDQTNRWSWGGMQATGGSRTTNTTGNCFSNVGSAHTTAATTNASNVTVEWNFFFPDPTGNPTEISGNMNYMGGDYGNQNQNCYGNFMFQKSDQTTHSDGIFFKMSSGNFRKPENIFRTTVYGYSRRPAPTT
tara:strand:+ start:1735 stop:2397 length:663 start_codon:yes stop_codon:yes gene_type:complete